MITCFASGAYAQSTTGSIYGTVADATGAVVSNASVTLRSTETNLKQVVTSNGAGEYTFSLIRPGSYTVSVTALGFKTETQTGIALSANQNIHVPFSLAPGQVDESVQVEAGVTMVDTREAQFGETIDESRIENLPILNRDVYSLLTIIPGVTNYSADIPIGSRDGVQFSSNGLPNNQESFYLDGAYDNAIHVNGGNKMPNPDALREFRVLTTNFDAEFGRAPGAIVNAITRSGTDKYHGTVYDYLRNNVLNARGYFTSAALPPVQLNQNQFGSTFGGPMKFLPKTFFFLSYQGLRLRTEDVINAGTIQTLTTTERAGNFSQDATDNVFGTTGTFKRPTLPAGTNCGTTAAPIICPAALDPVAQAALAFIPVGSDPGSGAFNHLAPQQTAKADSVADEGLARIDYGGLANHQIEAMFYTSHGSSLDHAPGGNQVLNYTAMNNYEDQANAVLGDTWILSPKTVNALYGFYTQNHYILSNYYPNHFIQNLGSLMTPGGIVYPTSQFNLSGYANVGGAGIGPSDIDAMQFGGSDTVNMTRGNHVIKAGGSYIWNKYQETGASSAGGNFTFTGSSTGNTFADFLLGKANALTQTNSNILRLHQYDPSLFVQDDWQISKRLNLNLGLRWEMFPPYVGNPGFGTFKANTQSVVQPTAPLGLLFQGDPGIPTGILRNPMRDFAPRVGFAYDAAGNGTTSIRGGFGVFFMTTPLYSSTASFINPPFALKVTTSQLPNLVCPYGLKTAPLGACPSDTPTGATYGDPFPYNPAQPNYQNPAAGSTIGAAPTNGGSTPYVYEYNLTVEQQLNSHFALHVAYVGNGMRKNIIPIDENSPVYAPGASTTTAGLLARRPYNPTPSTFRFGAITLYAPIWNGNYNSLQTTLRGKFKNFSMFSSYVWGKSLDFGGAVVDSYDIGMNHGASNLDIRHRFVTSYLYSLPTVQRFGWAGAQVLSGWRLSGITSFQSGSPFTITSGVDTNLDGTNNDRVDVLGYAYYSGHRSRAQKIQQYINPTVLAVPTGPYGNEQKNMFYGPGTINTDLALAKEFTLPRSLRFQFRTEFLNAFGNVNLGNPKTTLSNLVSPQISTAGPARVIQFAARLNY